MTLRHIASTGLAAAALLLGVGAAAAEPLKLRYELWAGGMGLLGVDFVVEETGGDYRVASELRTRGLTDTLFRFVMRATTEGGIADQGLTPRRYAAHSRSRRGGRGSEIEFFPDGQVSAAISPIEEEPRTALPAHSLAGSLDPLSATLAVARSLVGGGKCAGLVPIFDGKRRYDVVLEDRGIEELAPSSWSAFKGTARSCRVRQIRIGGFLERVSQDTDITPEAAVWMAPMLPGTLPVPVRIEIDSGWGSIVIHVVEASHGGTTRRLAEQ